MYRIKDPGARRSGPTSFVVGTVCFAVALVLFYVATILHTTTKVCTVSRVDRTTDYRSTQQSDMRIYTTCGVYKVGDIALRGQFNSADIYSSIQPNKTYVITSVGYRIPIFSQFPKVLGFPQEVTR